MSSSKSLKRLQNEEEPVYKSLFDYDVNKQFKAVSVKDKNEDSKQENKNDNKSPYAFPKPSESLANQNFASNFKSNPFTSSSNPFVPKAIFGGNNNPFNFGK